MNASPALPQNEPVQNEPVRMYGPGSDDRARLKAALAAMVEEDADIPVVIEGESLRPQGFGAAQPVVMPHDHKQVLGHSFPADVAEVNRAIEAAERTRPLWSSMSLAARSAVFLKAAELAAGPYRDRLNASTMLGQSKTVMQAELDAACELVDFFRFNVRYAHDLLHMQPHASVGALNRLEFRPLDGFVLAITPFNFTAIACNLPTAPALLGNTVVWKPAPNQLLSAHITLQLLTAAGLPPGVINFLPGPAPLIVETALASPRLGGIHFTGSTAVFKSLWAGVGRNISSYAQYPRIVGETGGKDFIFAHPSADVEALTTAIIRGGYENQGQKCSASSRIYLPRTLAKAVIERLNAEIASIKVGDVRDFSNFMGAVIDERAFKRITGYIDRAKADPSCKLWAGGGRDAAVGWFVHPTLFETTDPKHELMREEIFGPVVTVFTYEEANLEATLALVDQTTEYALTGAVFAQDRRAIEYLTKRLCFAAGNFYINDKPTGAVVGQQPFGGSRGSGTNDKAGSAWNLMRWISPRTIKETLVPPVAYGYPHML